VTDPSTRKSQAFLADRRAAGRFTTSRLTLQDVHEVRLLVRGDSVVDWHRLALRSEQDVRRLLRVNGIDLDQPADRDRLEQLRQQAHDYATATLGLRVDPVVASEVPAAALPLLASRSGRHQRGACLLLKVMHIIYHLDARELRTVLSIPDNLLYAMVEQSVVEVFDELGRAGVPVAEFSWSRKTRPSLITKLLVKRETSAAQVFDRLRFRLVVERASDLLPTLNVMLHRLIPFNYVLPQQTVNTLVDTAPLERRIAKSRDLHVAEPALPEGRNEFSGRGYQILNFVADLPVRVDKLLEGTPYEAMPGNLVFVLAEFQIVDRQRADLNETGDSSHDAYKKRQHGRVKERLYREPRQPSKGSGSKKH
jgi:uncharacterized protein (TIGR04552 family)